MCLVPISGIPEIEVPLLSVFSESFTELLLAVPCSLGVAPCPPCLLRPVASQSFMSYAGGMGRLACSQQAPYGAQQWCWLPAPQRLRSTATCYQLTCTRPPARHLLPSSQACSGHQHCGITSAPSSLRLRKQPWSHSRRRHGIAPLLAADDGADPSTGDELL